MTNGIVEIDTLLQQLSPRLQAERFVFCTVPKGQSFDWSVLQPVASFQEQEGLSLVLTEAQARQAGFPVEACFCQITLSVHSSLEAVGLTAAIAAALTQANISANVIAAYYHDHVFVPAEQAEQALQVLRQLTASP